MYVNDWSLRADDNEGTFDLYLGMKRVLSEVGFTFRKLITNQGAYEKDWYDWIEAVPIMK